MATIVTRSGKGSALTHNEVDANFNNLNTGKLEIPSGGSADQVLTYASAGTAAWADAGGAFAASTVTITANTTLTTAQNGNLINVTATGEKVISLPAAAAGAFYVFNNDTSHTMFIKPNGTNTINGVGASLSLAPDASGIMACGSSTTNWSSIGMTRTMLLVKATTFYNTVKNEDNGTRVTGTYTPFNSGSGLLVCVGSGVAGAGTGTSSSSSYYYRGGGSGGQSYAEKFIASPASSYAYDIPCGPSRDGHSGSYSLATTAAGMSCTFGPSSPGSGHNSANVAGRSGGTASGGTVNFTGGSGASSSTSTSGGGGGAASRAGNGGNAATGYGGGTGGNNATSSAVGAAATARDSSTYAITNSTSETYLAGTQDIEASNYTGSGAGPKTVVNVGSLSFTIADHNDLLQGGPVGAGAGGYSRYGLGGYVTFVEFF